MARLQIHQRRRLAPIALHLRPAHAFDRIVRDRAGELAPQGAPAGRCDRGSGWSAVGLLQEFGEDLGASIIQCQARPDAMVVNPAMQLLRFTKIGCGRRNLLERRHSEVHFETRHEEHCPYPA